MAPHAQARPPAPDQSARDQALDTTRSWIVQAPAGAGKTELLTSRFLALLAKVDEPEEILAITFTRAATAEMRDRVLKALAEAASRPARLEDEPSLTLARAALAHAQARGWRLLEQPHRLDIQTIDAIAMRFAHAQPLLARLGGRLDPVDDGQTMYLQAARRTLQRLGDTRDADLSSALAHLLLLRDNNQGEVQQLIAAMLGKRDQWAHAIPLGIASAIDWNALRAQLEQPFVQAIERTLSRLRALLMAEPLLPGTLLELGRYACENENEGGIELLRDLRALPGTQADSIEHWLCLANFLLTKGSGWRKTANIKTGFPVRGTPAEKHLGEERRQSMLDLLTQLRQSSQSSELLDAFCELRTLPAPRYEASQWETVQAIFRILRRAAAELRVVFAERDQVDFIELGLAAQQVLTGGSSEPIAEQTQLALDRKLHLLIDEFQDTSRRQHSFLSLLLGDWQPGDGRTVFLVGDPMQSIYLFRQAEFELFHHVQKHGIPCGPHTHPCGPLHLKANFRSHAGLVKPLNRYFARIFAKSAAGSPGVDFAPSAAIEKGEHAVHVHAFFAEDGETESTDRARNAEAKEVVAVLSEHYDRAERARLSGGREYKIAVLVRARAHLARTSALLREARIPYRAIELESLTERQEILDLLSLTRALLVPADRVAWLSVLRAPWAGLMLRDLHLLTGADDRMHQSTPIPELLRARRELLSSDAQVRLGRLLPIFEQARATRFEGSFSGWIERTWQALGGPASLDASSLENTRVFFELLDKVSPDGMEVLGGDFRASLAKLCAEPDVNASAQYGIELLTIHKSKGLGFDVVLVPGLERRTRPDDRPLVTLLERFNPSKPHEEEVLLAPLGPRGEDTHPTYTWIRKQRALRENEERKRLVYVACTRARRELHLFGTAKVSSTGRVIPRDANSLLGSAWPALQDAFDEAYRAQQQPSSALLLPFPETGIFDIAASAAGPKLILHRLPADYAAAPGLENVTDTRTNSSASVGFTRPEGSRSARAQGTAVHALFEVLAAAFAADPNAAAETLIPRLTSRASQLLRQAAFSGAELDRLTREAVAVALKAANHAEGRWTLAPHPEAQSEQAWTLWKDGAARTVRADRTFLAGAEPGSSGTTHLWVVDYKTGPAPSGDIEEYLAAQQQLYRPQLEAYGAAAVASRSGAPVSLRYALYFPQLQRLQVWQD
jgi:ATP-dependent helicase/nuclease subunit A